jgi:hypothetical protein
MSAPFRPYEPDRILLFPPNPRELDLKGVYAYCDLKPILDPQGQVLGVEAKSGVVELCQEAGLVKLGHVALDGTMVKADAFASPR